MRGHVFDWDEFPTVTSMRPGTMRESVSGTNVSVAHVRVAADTHFDGTLHAHENEQILLMVAGRIELQIDEARGWVEPGQLAYFPPGSYHAAVGVGSDGAEYFEIFAPPRFDQLIGYIGASPMTFRRPS